MIIKGREIANSIRMRIADDVSDLGFTPKVALLQVGSHPAIDSFVSIKKKIAGLVGIELVKVSFDEGVTTEDLLQEIDLLSRSEDANGKKLYHGLIVQLPLPDNIDVDTVLNAVPRDLDIDVLSQEAQDNMYEDGVLPPVAGAVREVLRKTRTDLRENKVAVIGTGRLVGAPVIKWLEAQGIEPIVVNKQTGDLKQALSEAQVIISGVGQPGLITKDMVNEKHVLIDAGTSESGGVVRGDVDPGCAEVVKAMTPVPGGVGPITVAVLFQNLLGRLQLDSE